MPILGTYCGLKSTLFCVFVIVFIRRNSKMCFHFSSLQTVLSLAIEQISTREMSQMGMASPGGSGAAGGGSTPAGGDGGPPGPTQVSAMPLPPMQYVKKYSEEHRGRGGSFPPPPPPLAPNEQYRMFGQPFAPAEDQIISR